MNEVSGKPLKKPGWFKRFRHWLLQTPLPFIGVWLLVHGLNLLPLALARLLGRCGGWAAYYLDVGHRGTCLDNLHLAFPEKTPLERRAILMASYKHLGVLMADFCRLKKLSNAQVRAWIVPEEGAQERNDAAKAKGKGLLAVAAHIGFWELSGYAFPLLGNPVISIGRKIASEPVDKFVNAIRSRSGNEVVPQEGALRHMLRALKEQKAVGIIMDQHAGRDAPQVPFFGQDASTVDTVARLHLKTGAPMTCNLMIRRSDGKYTWRCRNIDVPLPENETDEQLVKNILAACNREFEQAIRETPEQWLWMHRRWRVSKTGAIEPAATKVATSQ